MGKKDEEQKTVSEELEKVEVDVNEDVFEKLLNEEVEIPTDDDEEDAGSDTSDKEGRDSESPKKEDVEEAESVEALKARIAELEKENKGRLDSVIKSRQDKAQLRSELDQLKGAVSTLLEQRKAVDGNNATKDEEEKKVPFAETRRAIEFGDGDDAFVDLSEVKEAIEANKAETKAELEALKEKERLELAQRAYVENVRSVVETNEEVLAPAYDQLGPLYKELNDYIIKIQEREEIAGDDGTIPQDQALELFDGSPEQEEWEKNHPGLDPTRIARAYNSKYDLKVGLNHIAKLVNNERAEASGMSDDDRIAKAKQKPGSLAGQENRGSAADNLIEKVAALSVSDMESMSDAEVAKIEQLLLKEEQSS